MSFGTCKFTASVPPQYTGNPQLDWVDTALAVESWLTHNIGAKGSEWDYYTHSQLQQIVFEQERHCFWFKLYWAGP